MPKKLETGQKPSLKRESTEQLLADLQKYKCAYDAESREHKLARLTELGRRSLRHPDLIRQFHDLLCFMQAHPESPAQLEKVDELLDGFHARIDRARETFSATRFSELSGTGIVGTDIDYPFSFHTAKWLAEHYPDDIVISWEDFEQVDLLCQFLPAMTSPFEAPALEDVDLDPDVWVNYAAEREGKTDFGWLMERITQSGMPEMGLEAFYELLDLPLTWSLRPETTSRTHARVKLSEVVYQQSPLLKKNLDTKSLLKKALPPLQKLSPAKGRKLIGEAISVLSVRNREIYPLFYANPRDVIVVELERGVTLILIGMRPQRRFSFETDYFFLGLKNNIPVTYGSSVICLDQAEIAVNIFSSFRQGESALLYTQILRTIHQLFGARVFLVEKFQIGGDDNSDALQSGAFWFYHKLGFRPVDPEIAAFAETESQKRQTTPGHRTPLPGLEKLAESDMRLFLSGTKTRADQINLRGLGLLASEYLGIRPGQSKSTRSKQMALARKEAQKLLGIRDLSRWTKDEKFWLGEFSPLVVNIPKLDTWSKQERRDLAALIRAKGKTSELEYVLRWNQHEKFKKALSSLSKKGAKLRARLLS